MTRETIYATLSELYAMGYTFTIITNLLYQKSEGIATEIYPSDIERNDIAQFITAVDFHDDSLAIYYSTQPTNCSRERSSAATRKHFVLLGYESITAIKSGYSSSTRTIEITKTF